MVAHDGIGGQGAARKSCISEVCARDAFERFARYVRIGFGECRGEVLPALKP